MAVDWLLRGPEIATCNCAWGCPCQFNSRPTSGHCRAAVAMRVDKGHFGDVTLDGLHWAATVAWPGAIHEGGGEILPIVDDRADEKQREALLTIMSGEESEPGATVFSVFASVIDTVHDPQFLPISFEMDLKARTGHFSVPGLVEARVEPIRNPITGDPHPVHVSLPEGFEYHEAEYASSTTHGTGPVPLDWSDRHSHLTMLDMTRAGPQG